MTMGESSNDSRMGNGEWGVGRWKVEGGYKTRQEQDVNVEVLIHRSFICKTSANIDVTAPQ